MEEGDCLASRAVDADNVPLDLEMEDEMKEAALTTGIIDDGSVEKLKIDFGGEVLRPGDAGYDDARVVYNGMFQSRKPAAILRCNSTEEVVAAVNFARQSGLLVAVKGAGHGIAGFAVVDGGVVIDVSPMKKTDVDPQARVAKAQGGVTWAEFDAATAEHGLATPGGFVSTTGIAGLTLNGGLGYLSRKYGLSCDNLIGAEVVTANGEVVYTSESDNPDLFWGLRGGGGNFGIVARFEYALHPVTDIYLAIAMYPSDRGAEVLRHYREVTSTQPEEMMTAVLFFTVPVNPMFPEELHGQKTFAIFGGYIGPESEGEPHTRIVSQLPDPLLSFAMTVPYPMAQQMQDEDSPYGRQNYWKSGLFNDLTDEMIDQIAALAPTTPSRLCQWNVIGLEGAIAKVGENDTAYSNRKARFNFSIDNIWEDPAEDESQIKWSRDSFAKIKPHLTGVYLNFIGDEGEEGVKTAFGAKYARLRALKSKYDPTNLFRLNQNIRPS